MRRNVWGQRFPAYQRGESAKDNAKIQNYTLQASSNLSIVRPRGTKKGKFICDDIDECYGAFTPTETETDRMGLKPNDIGHCICLGQYEHFYTISYNPFFIGLGLCQCEHAPYGRKKTPYLFMILHGAIDLIG